jgi:hypothetical protein
VIARQLVYTCVGGAETGTGPVVLGTDGSAHPEERSDGDVSPDLGEPAGDASGLDKQSEVQGHGITQIVGVDDPTCCVALLETDPE